METLIHLAAGRWPPHSIKKSLPVENRVVVEAAVAKISPSNKKKEQRYLLGPRSIKYNKNKLKSERKYFDKA